MNIFESHVDGCAACEPLLFNRKPTYCRRGGLLEDLVIRDFLVGGDGRVYSTDRERGYRICVEISDKY